MTKAIMLALVLPGCVLPRFDLDEPIVLVPEPEWPAPFERDLVLAAECWNLEFGTHLTVDRAGDGPQRVSVAFNELACVRGAGSYHPRFVGEIDICPLPAVIDITFVVVLHELGHVLNIYEHGNAGVMAPSGGSRSLPDNLFDAEDHALFEAANPDYRDRGACTVTQRYPLPCACR